MLYSSFSGAGTVVKFMLILMTEIGNIVCACVFTSFLELSAVGITQTKYFIERFDMLIDLKTVYTKLKSIIATKSNLTFITLRLHLEHDC